MSGGDHADGQGGHHANDPPDQVIDAAKYPAHVLGLLGLRFFHSARHRFSEIGSQKLGCQNSGLLWEKSRAGFQAEQQRRTTRDTKGQFYMIKTIRKTLNSPSQCSLRLETAPS